MGGAPAGGSVRKVPPPCRYSFAFLSAAASCRGFASARRGSISRRITLAEQGCVGDQIPRLEVCGIPLLAKYARNGAPVVGDQIPRLEVCGIPLLAKDARNGAPVAGDQIPRLEVCGIPLLAKDARNGAPVVGDQIPRLEVCGIPLLAKDARNGAPASAPE